MLVQTRIARIVNNIINTNASNSYNYIIHVDICLTIFVHTWSKNLLQTISVYFFFFFELL